MDILQSNQAADIESIVRQVMSEMNIAKRGAKDSSVVSTNGSSSRPKTKKKKQKKSRKESRKLKDEDDSKKKKRRSARKASKRDRERRLQRTNELVGSIEKLMDELEELRNQRREEQSHQIPGQITMDERRLSDTAIVGYTSSDDFSEVSATFHPSDDEIDELTMSTTSRSDATISTVGTTEFYRAVAARLRSQNGSICIQGDFVPSEEEIRSDRSLSQDLENARVDASFDDFDAAFGPKDMRCLALVSHNEMKSTMRDFVVTHKHILKKFRLTGTQSTMKMLREVFADEPDVVFGPSCQSGPLGGDAELVALMTRGELGGILFFQDPMTSHPHQADIQCLVRQALVHNTLIATTPTTAMGIMEVLRSALRGAGKPELIPSFFFSLQSPTVDTYKTAQSEVVSRCSRVSFCEKDTVHTYSKKVVG